MNHYEFVLTLPIIEYSGKNYVVYRITNSKTGRIYIGCAKMSDEFYRYYGSGVLIQRDLKRYGRSSFNKDILFEYDNKIDAFNKEKELVNKIAKNNEMFYNIQIGGQGGQEISLYQCNDGVNDYRKTIEEIENNPLLMYGYMNESWSPNIGKTVYNNGVDHIYLNDNEIVPDSFVKGRLFHPASGKVWVNLCGQRTLINETDLQEFVDKGYSIGFDSSGEISKMANNKLTEYRNVGKLNSQEANYQPKQHLLSGIAGKILIDQLLLDGYIILESTRTNKTFYQNLLKYSPYNVSLILLENHNAVNKFSSANGVTRQFKIQVEIN